MALTWLSLSREFKDTLKHRINQTRFIRSFAVTPTQRLTARCEKRQRKTRRDGGMNENHLHWAAERRMEGLSGRTRERKWTDPPDRE